MRSAKRIFSHRLGFTGLTKRKFRCRDSSARARASALDRSLNCRAWFRIDGRTLDDRFYSDADEPRVRCGRKVSETYSPVVCAAASSAKRYENSAFPRCAATISFSSRPVSISRQALPPARRENSFGIHWIAIKIIPRRSILALASTLNERTQRRARRATASEIPAATCFRYTNCTECIVFNAKADLRVRYVYRLHLLRFYTGARDGDERVCYGLFTSPKIGPRKQRVPQIAGESPRFRWQFCAGNSRRRKPEGISLATTDPETALGRISHFKYHSINDKT